MMNANYKRGLTLGPGGRFRIERRLGEGSTGVVYAAWDHERQGTVALKTLRKMDADGIYHLKREFRSLANVAHPNLVRFFELFGETGEGPEDVEDRWFLTMEFIQGVDFISYVAADSSHRLLRKAFTQLIAGMDALHQAGKLHRDIKPSNALVTPEGRVLLLDFGLVTDVALTRLFHTMEPKLVGTPAYLSPEQATGAPLGPSTDFYAAGAMLFEALTGRPPFSGTLLQVLQAKQQNPPPSPRSLRGDVPEDLDGLCQALLQPNAGARPGAGEVRAMLGGSPLSNTQTLSAESPWVGRTNEIALINEAFQQARRGQAVILSVHGSSGVGKSALVLRALEAISRNDDAVVLAGRCYERELLPYRALDSVIDALTRHLGRLPHLEVQALLPRDVEALTRVFSVLKRVPAFDRPSRRLQPTDAQEQRRRAWQAFRELLGRIADQKPLLIFIDDWQWGDEDSALLLLEVLRGADVGGLMLVLCHRSEDDTACMRTFNEGVALVRQGDARLRFMSLPVLPVSSEEGLALIAALLPAAAAPQAKALEQEAAGNAFFLRALIDYVRAGNDTGASSATLEQMIQARLANLPDKARRLIEVLAIAGRPTPLEVTLHAADLGPQDVDSVTELRRQHLLRSHAGVVEIDHDRIRAAVTAALTSDSTQRRHQQLLDALLKTSQADPEVLGSHFIAVGNTARAAECFATAGVRAQEALAFERAAELLQRALQLQGTDVPAATPLHEQLGDAFASLGRGAEAAQAFLKAADRVGAAQALELRRRAAEQLLRVGHLEKGLEVLQVVLDGIGEKMASSSRVATLALLARRARMRLRGLRFRECQAQHVAPEKLARLDVFWSVSTALGIVDNLRATDFQTRHLRLALELGEPYRIARALAAEACYSAVKGTATRARTARLVAAARAAAARVNEPFAFGWATLAEGMGKYLEAQHAEASRLCEEAAATFGGCIGVSWEMASARLFAAWSMYYLGDWAQLAHRVPEQVSEAEARGDLYAATSLSTSVLCLPWLLNDDVKGGKRALERFMRRWPTKDFQALAYWQMMADCHFALYQNQGEAAWERLQAEEASLRRSLLLRVQTARVEWNELQGRCLLALAASPTGSTRASVHLKRVKRIAHALHKEGSLWAEALGHALRAGVTAALQPEGAAQAYRQAGHAFARAGMAGHAAAAHLRAWRWAPQDEQIGQAGRRAEAWLRTQGVKDVERLTQLLMPSVPAAAAGSMSDALMSDPLLDPKPATGNTPAGLEA